MYVCIATSVWGLKLLVYGASSYLCMGPSATSVCGLKLLVYGIYTCCYCHFDGELSFCSCKSLNRPYLH